MTDSTAEDIHIDNTYYRYISIITLRMEFGQAALNNAAPARNRRPVRYLCPSSTREIGILVIVSSPFSIRFMIATARSRQTHHCESIAVNPIVVTVLV